MKLDRFGISRFAILVFMALALSASAPGQGRTSPSQDRNYPNQDRNSSQDRNSQNQDRNYPAQARDAAVRPYDRTVSSGLKTSVKGIIIRRDADTFSVADDATGRETVVLLTNNTSVKSKGGFLRFGKDYDVTNLLRGLRVEVEGRGGQNGQLVADKVRFDANDLKTAKVVDSRVLPVEEAHRHLAGQVEEVNELTKINGERISSLDDYVVKESVTVLFRVNSAVLSPEDRMALDQLAAKAMTTKGYVIEIAGYTDSTGSVAWNRVLSQQRADEVVRYLQENHEIPLRRIVTPFGYGMTRPAADNSSPEGRRQNRRVEVKILVSKGMAGS
jgi:outer membrane protein OmpA-like peptidoglycan-associated protein